MSADCVLSFVRSASRIRSSMVSFVMMCCTTTVADLWPCRHSRATVCWYSHVALVFVWYELHSASPPIAFRISSICSAASRTYTLKPSNSNCLLRRTCKGRKVLPGALTSTNAILPPGKRTMRSGTPSYPGDMNFSAKPPIFFAFFTSFLSIIFSFTVCLRSDTDHDRHNFPPIYTTRVFALTVSNSGFIKAVLNIRGNGCVVRVRYMLLTYRRCLPYRGRRLIRSVRSQPVTWDIMAAMT